MFYYNFFFFIFYTNMIFIIHVKQGKLWHSFRLRSVVMR